MVSSNPISYPASKTPAAAYDLGEKLLAWWQFWYGYLRSCRSPEDAFDGMVAPPGWAQQKFIRCLGRTIYFVYPERPDFKAWREDHIL